MKSQPSAFRAVERDQQAKRSYAYRFDYQGTVFFYTSLDADLIVSNGPPAKFATTQSFTAAQVVHSRIVESVDGDESGTVVSLGAVDQNLRAFFLTVSPKEISVDIWRVASTALPGPVDYATGLRQIFSGILDSVSFDDATTISGTCVQKMHRQDRIVPRFNYQLVCNHVLYGPFCKVDRNLFTVATALTAISYPGRYVEIKVTSINVDSPPRAVTVTEETFVGGTVRLADGEAMGILASTTFPGGVRLFLEWLPRTLQVGQTVNVDCGCQHIKRICDGLFSNLFNFGGQPYVPVNNPAVDGINI